MKDPNYKKHMTTLLLNFLFTPNDYYLFPMKVGEFIELLTKQDTFIDWKIIF